MSLEKRIRDELHDTAERLALDPGEYRRAMELGAKRRRQRIGLILTSAVGLAAIVFAANAIEIGGTDEPGILAENTAATIDPATPSTLAPVPPVSTAPLSTTPAVREFGASLAVASTEGISVFDPGQEAAVLTGDPYYQSISWVASDGEGGLVYTHEVTPLPWEQGSLMRLPAGSANPTALVAPEAGGLITPIGVDNGSVFYQHIDLAGESSIRAVNLDGTDARIVVGSIPGFAYAAVDEGTLVITLDCGGYQFFSTDGAQLPTPDWATECRDGHDIALADGFLFTFSTNGPFRLVRIDLETGEQAETPMTPGWQIEADSASRVAFAKVVDGTAIIRVGDLSGDEFVETESYLGGPGPFALLSGLNLATDARLGSGLGELPCSPTDVPNPAPTGLPTPVEEKFQMVFTLAKTCELEALAELVRDDGAEFSSRAEDPVQTWVRSARHGLDTMPMTVRILNVPPALDGDIYAWPGVFVTNSEEDWQQLSGVLSAAEFEQMNQFRDPVMGYLGLRVGITTDGRLSYLIAGGG